MKQPLKGRVEKLRFESRCLKGNALGDPHERDVYVYLPASYDDGGRFPVVMLLAGFAGTHRTIFGYDAFRPNPIERFDALLDQGQCPEALLVLPDGMNRWGGSQFVDSPATGDYQTYLADEVMPLIDRHFRTVAAREGRAVMGRSSGGFGALRLGMDRPDRVAVVGSHAGDAAFEVSMRPMLTTAAIAMERAGGIEAFARKIDDGGPGDRIDFDGVFVLAAAAAYSPNLDAPWPHVELPFEPRTGVLRPEIWQRWLDHDPLELASKRMEALKQLTLVYLDAGDRDEHGLHFAARLLADAMTGSGVRIVHEEFEGGHRGTSWRYATSLPQAIQALERA